MFQSFANTATPEQGPARLAALRAAMVTEGLAGFIIPRADAHQGEYVAARDDRLAWLTGFTGSAGFCVALKATAGVFIDGRYRTQVKSQVALSDFAPVPWPDQSLGGWVAENLEAGIVGFDPWLHTAREIEAAEAALIGTDVNLTPCANLIDTIWPDQPAAPMGKISPYPADLAGESHADKRARLAQELRDAGHASAVLTLPDSIAWLLNIRGTDIAKNPVPHCFAILNDTGKLSLFVAPEKCNDALYAHLGNDITRRAPVEFEAALGALKGPVRVDKASAPLAVKFALEAAGTDIAWGDDPCVLPKACKNATEIANTTEAHLRDAAALCEFLTWYEPRATSGLSEIDLVRELEARRRATNALMDISFDTIAGAGPNGAIMHYRVSENTNRTLKDGDLVVLDSGGQYLDGTTDITRTLPVGDVGEEERRCFTRVLQGMIAISRARWPVGLAGRDLDALARAPLWMAGQDFDHGTGHGVGVYLCVHEGPQRLSRASHEKLQPGMILSNEPGYYREGAFGIRIENLIVVQDAPELGGADAREMLDFQTLTYVPIDRRLIMIEMMSTDERRWLNEYHAACRARVTPRLSPEAALWLEQATAPL